MAQTRPSLLRYARAAGVGYLVIIGTGIFAEFGVRARLVVPADAAATAANIAASEGLFRWAMAAEFVMLTADVMVALALYAVFASVNRPLALMAAAFRTTHAAVVAANLLNLHAVLGLVGAGTAASPLPEAHRQALALLRLDAHAYGYAVGLVFFGAYCGLLAYLVLRSRAMPRVLGWLLGVAGTAYVTDALARTLLPHYADLEHIFGMMVLGPAFVAELSFSMWLVIRGVDTARLAVDRTGEAA